MPYWGGRGRRPRFEGAALGSVEGRPSTFRGRRPRKSRAKPRAAPSESRGRPRTEGGQPEGRRPRTVSSAAVSAPTAVLQRLIPARTASHARLLRLGRLRGDAHELKPPVRGGEARRCAERHGHRWRVLARVLLIRCGKLSSSLVTSQADRAKRIIPLAVVSQSRPRSPSEWKLQTQGPSARGRPGKEQALQPARAPPPALRPR